MLHTRDLFEQRKKEVDFYFSILENIDNGNIQIDSENDSLFFRILKSNFLLMIYNLVEACIESGLKELEEAVSKSNVCFDQLADSIQVQWILSQITDDTNPEKKICTILKKIRKKEPVVIHNLHRIINGNVGQKQIFTICKTLSIRHKATDRNGYVDTVRTIRQKLSHGDESFGDCSKDLTVQQLTDIKETVLNFIESIIDGMDNYITTTSFLASSS